MSHSFVVTKSIDYKSNNSVIEKFFIEDNGDAVLYLLKREEMEQLLILIQNSLKKEACNE